MPLVTLTLREGKSAQTAVLGTVHQALVSSGWAFGGGRIIHA